MSTIAVGDIHGNLLALNALLELLRDQITDDDTVVFLGDYIHRGPDTKGCIDSILVFREEVAGDIVASVGITKIGCSALWATSGATHG